MNEFDQPEVEFSEAMSDIILLIEEPEIYQHPIKQKVIYDAISQLCTAFNKQTGIRMQVVFTTHSEKMIEMGAFHSLRIIRKVSENGSFRTECSSCKILKCSEQLAALLDPPKPPMSDEAFAAKLHIFSREVSEGFFSDKVILVEGGTDKAILEGAFRSRDRDAPSEGLSIICIDGKTKLDKPFLIFGNLGIPAYMVFDNDEGDKKDIQKKIATNILLQKVCGVEEPMEFPVGVNELFAAFDGDLESYLRTVVGDDFSPLLEQIATQWGLSQKEISKTPVAMSSFFFLAGQKGYQFELLDAIIDKVDRLT